MAPSTMLFPISKKMSGGSLAPTGTDMNPCEQPLILTVLMDQARLGRLGPSLLGLGFGP